MYSSLTLQCINLLPKTCSGQHPANPTPPIAGPVPAQWGCLAGSTFIYQECLDFPATHTHPLSHSSRKSPEPELLAREHPSIPCWPFQIKSFWWNANPLSYWAVWKQALALGVSWVLRNYPAISKCTCLYQLKLVFRVCEREKRERERANHPQSQSLKFHQAFLCECQNPSTATITHFFLGWK